MAVYFDQDMAGATIQINDGSNDETWSYDTEVNDTGSDLYTAIESFKTWANDGARGWNGTLSFDYIFTTFGENHGITIVGTGAGFALTTNSVTVATMGLPTGTTAVSAGGGGPVAGDAGVRTTLTAKYAFRSKRSMEGKEGGISSSGSWQNDPMHSRLFHARITSVLKHASVYALSIALQHSSTPRRAVFYDYMTSTYRRVLVPELSVNVGRRNLHRLDFAVIEAT